jgi:glycosyltransferase involved in cell wall biosynthesis
MKKRVLVVATSINTMGGISSVIKGYQQTQLWSDWSCFWLATHIDKNGLRKISILLFSLIKFLVLLPFYSIIHLHLSETTSALRKSIFIFIARLFNKKIIVHLHSFSIATSINGKHKGRYQRIFFSSNRIIVLSEQWKIWLTNNWPNLENRIKVLYNPCPIVQNIENDDVKTKTILFAGTLNQRKGYADLIKAFSLIADSFADWKLVFAGNGELDKAKLLCHDFHIQNQVDFKGWVIGKQKDKLFREASVFCLPSYAEGFPMAVLDAWAYGLPVITTPVGGLPDVLIHESNSLVFNAGDVFSLSQNLERLIVDDNLRQKISYASLVLSKNQFGINRITQELSEIYNDLT